MSNSDLITRIIEIEEKGDFFEKLERAREIVGADNEELRVLYEKNNAFSTRN